MFQRAILTYGHGGMLDVDGDGKPEYQTAGKQYHFDSGLSFYEGVFNRRVAAQVANILLAVGAEVHDGVAGRRITEPVRAEDLEQSDVSLARRVAYANKYRQDVLVDIHANAAGVTSLHGEGWSRAHGGMVFTSRGQTSSDAVATSLVGSMRAGVPQIKMRQEFVNDTDPDYEKDFYVLRKTQDAAVLIECGFFTNPAEAAFMYSDVGVSLISQAIAAGLLPHLIH